jgi:PAS domain S-box-containing protein
VKKSYREFGTCGNHKGLFEHGYDECVHRLAGFPRIVGEEVGAVRWSGNHLLRGGSIIILALLLVLFAALQMPGVQTPLIQALALAIWGAGALILLRRVLEREFLTPVRQIRRQLEAAAPLMVPSPAGQEARPHASPDFADDLSAIMRQIQALQHDGRCKDAQYRRIIDHAPLGILVIDDQGQLLEVNPVVLAMFGVPDETTLRQQHILTMPILTESGLAADMHACLMSGAPALSERMYPTSWGEDLYLRAHLTPLTDEAQQVIAVQAIIEDITERTLVEQALKSREAEYRSLFKNMQSGLAYQKIIVDDQARPVDYVFLDVNEAFERLTGLRHVIGRRITEVMPQLSSIEPNLIAIYGQVAATGEETMFESFFAPIGMWFSIAVYSPEPGYCVAVYTDITERKWAEESLRKLNEDLEHRVEARTLELQNINRFLEESLSALEKAQKQLVESEKMAALGGLVAGVTHEVSTPLGIGVTAASHLEHATQEILARFEQDHMTRSDLDAYLHTAGESARMILANLARAAENIQSFKQVAVDQTHDARRPFNLKHCIDNVLLSLRPKLKRTPYTIAVTCPDTLELDSYPGAFSQILTNFMMNALLHGFDGRAEGQITLTVQQRQADLQITFHDNGRGMEADQLAHIFEPFFTTRREQGGTGLGLHIVYNLVTQTLGGQIECSSVPNQGTTFVLTIPLEPQGDRSHEY